MIDIPEGEQRKVFQTHFVHGAIFQNYVIFSFSESIIFRLRVIRLGENGFFRGIA